MTFRLSNNLLGILNLVTFLFSIPILGGGVWLSRKGINECEKFFDKPIIVVGVILMIVSVAGLIAACYRVTALIWFYLVIIFLVVLLGIYNTVFALLVLNKGAGEVLSGKGYKEYRLQDYSKWMQKRVNNESTWFTIKSCLADSKVCTNFHTHHLNDTVQEFYKAHLSALQSGCCKPSNDCEFTYVGPTNWTKGKGVFTNNDCNTWENDLDTLCFNCKACKAGFIDNLRTESSKVMVINIVFFVCLVLVYFVACCAFRNTSRDKF
ncbi:tetraspanin7 [Hibiscus trionum]|uniref:Tetraspanin7 n=1 Tax=Hibiscus trionum TaxID=183268 RepID=A0A9W7LZP5_HIBTR|nr:tetraspanin7 [Hibiscus trionum]